VINLSSFLGKPGQCFQPPPALTHVSASALRPQPSHAQVAVHVPAHIPAVAEDVTHAVQDHLKIQLLIRSYQVGII
jgi:hypothetical protein